jgi:hypothetical protein
MNNVKTLCVIETVTDNQKPVDLVLSQSVWGIWLMVRTGNIETMMELDRIQARLLQNALGRIFG